MASCPRRVLQMVVLVAVFFQIDPVRGAGRSAHLVGKGQARLQGLFPPGTSSSSSTNTSSTTALPRLEKKRVGVGEDSKPLADPTTPVLCLIISIVALSALVPIGCTIAAYFRRRERRAVEGETAREAKAKTAAGRPEAKGGEHPGHALLREWRAVAVTSSILLVQLYVYNVVCNVLIGIALHDRTATDLPLHDLLQQLLPHVKGHGYWFGTVVDAAPWSFAALVTAQLAYKSEIRGLCVYFLVSILVLNLKSFAQLLTVVPDSRGHRDCMAHFNGLCAPGSCDAYDWPSKVAWIFIRVDLPPVMCWDMMWSGHMSIFTVALITQWRLWAEGGGWSKPMLATCTVLLAVSMGLSLLLVRLHYTMDIFVAIVVSALLICNEHLRKGLWTMVRFCERIFCCCKDGRDIAERRRDAGKEATFEAPWE